MSEWYSVANVMPPENVILDTKIDDVHGVRNEQQLIRQGNLWWIKDKSIYVYYRPTHWRYP